MLRSLTLFVVAAIILCLSVFSGAELAAQVKPDIIKKIEAALPKAAPAKAPATVASVEPATEAHETSSADDPGEQAAEA